jgi:protein-tyrosine phosphatase
MEQILEHLWLGSLDDAERAHLSPLPRIEMLFTLREKPLEMTPLSYIHMPMPDEVILPAAIWEERVQKLAELQRMQICTLVHCRLGVSRSPALVASYLAHCGMMPTPLKALGYVMGRRSVVNVHEATWRGVEYWWSRRNGNY